MNVKQFLCAGMTGALLVAGLTACAPGAPEVDPSDVAYQTAGVTRDTVLFTVDGTEVTADEYLFWLLQSVASAKQSGYLADDDAWEEELNGVPTAEYLKEDARNTSVLYTTVSNHAAAAGLTVTEEEQAEADAELETLTQRVDSYYGMTLQEYLDQQCISEAAFRKLNQVPYLARSLQTQMEEAGELTAQDADLDAMVEEAGYYKAKHILLAFPENEDGSAVTDEQKAAVKAEADQLLAQIRTAADPLVEFDKVMNERSDDGRDENNQLYAPDGYLAYAGQMVPQFESTAKALAVGEISEPVETAYGYHIILRQDFTDEERQQLRHLCRVLGHQVGPGLADLLHGVCRRGGHRRNGGRITRGRHLGASYRNSSHGGRCRVYQGYRRRCRVYRSRYSGCRRSHGRGQGRVRFGHFALLYLQHMGGRRMNFLVLHAVHPEGCHRGQGLQRGGSGDFNFNHGFRTPFLAVEHCRNWRRPESPAGSGLHRTCWCSILAYWHPSCGHALRRPHQTAPRPGNLVRSFPSPSVRPPAQTGP